MTRFLPLLFVAFALAGCPTDENGGDTGILTFPDCEAIIEACHDVDDGTPGMASDCHDLAHDADSNDDCAPMRAACVTACMAIDGGVHHDEDAGEHHHDEDAGEHEH